MPLKPLTCMRVCIYHSCFLFTVHPNICGFLPCNRPWHTCIAASAGVPCMSMHTLIQTTKAPLLQLPCVQSCARHKLPLPCCQHPLEPLAGISPLMILPTCPGAPPHEPSTPVCLIYYPSLKAMWACWGGPYAWARIGGNSVVRSS